RRRHTRFSRDWTSDVCSSDLPAGNQVLEKRAGYRDMYKLYVQSELAAMLSWPGGDDVYSAGQKDVAVLYEYWGFLQLARMISSKIGRASCWERVDSSVRYASE